jgi:hypothetical protein
VTGTELAPLTPAQRAELDAWMRQHGDVLPQSVRAALQQHQALCDGLLGSRRKLSQVLLQLRRALGITASSERRGSGDPLRPATASERPPQSRRQRLELDIERQERLLAWHQELVDKGSRTLNAKRSKLMGMPEDLEPEADEHSDAKKAADQAAVRAQIARLQLGGGEAQPALQSSNEAFMTGAQVATVEQTLPWPAPAVPQHEGKIVDTIIDERERFDFTFTMRRITVQVEKKIIETPGGERSVVSTSTAPLGPPRYAVTWEFLAHMTVLVVQYAMPMNRLATLLSTETKRFTAGALARLLRYVAQRFAPIYMTLFDSLADARVLSGDDTSCRVLEVNRYFARADTAGEPPPWHDYRTIASAQSLLQRGDVSLAAELASELGFEHGRRNGDGNKKALHTTTISGRSDAEDPSSLVVFYRSHLGGFGDLLQMLLRKRSPKQSALTIQSDLSTVNLVADAELQRLFTFRYAGCTSHARRPFALYEHEDPEYCAAMLHLFTGLFIHERGLDLVGRNADNVAAVRGVDCRDLWQRIKALAIEMSENWSRETKLGEGARYITRNFDKLTAYLDDPRLSLTNNFSERMLRLEKLIENSSLFRTSLEGRFALDIMRSVLQTAVAARAPLQTYVLAVLRADPVEVAANPERFTPRAWAAANSGAETPHTSD